ncbi:MAG: PD40 domain-containing protein [Candidatus Eisenbacteria bacterium]|nr:PD40 domain-containing protein [Candidatus Eisenbacteria bacterium]
MPRSQSTAAAGRRASRHGIVTARSAVTSRSLPAVCLLAAALCAAPAGAQGVFGANKVLYQPLNWLSAVTPHLRLYFYPQEAELARATLAVAESACVEYEARIGHRLSKPIPMFVFSSHRDFESSNILPGASPEEVGGVTELMRGRVLIPHTGSHARLVHVVRHELAHAFMLDHLSAAAKKSRAVLRQQPPLWFVEGWAEHLSGGWTSDDDMVLRTAVLGGFAQDLEHLWRVEGSFLMYKEGQSFLDFAAPRVGGTAGLAKFFEAWPRKQTAEECAQAAWGMALEDLGREWFASLRRRYYPLISERREASEFATPLASRGWVNLRPAVVPGTSRATLQVVHFSDQGDYPGVWLWERRGLASEQRRLVRGGNRRGYESLHFFETRMGVSRRGELALVSRQGSRDVIHVLGLPGGEERAEFESPGLVSLGSPSWSPGGDSLVVRGQDLAGDADLYLVDRGTGAFTRLTHDAYDDRDPVFTPDGAAITFSSDRGPDGPEGRQHLFELRRDGSLRGLTSGRCSDTQPAWSPDGKRLAFVSDRGGAPDLYALEPGRGCARLTRVLGAAWDPAWEADSTHLVFSQYSGGKFEMFEMSVADSALEWSPETGALAADWSRPLAPADTPVEPYRRRWGLGLVQTGFNSDPEVGGSSGQLALQDLLGNEELSFFLGSSTDGLSNLVDDLDIGATYVNYSHRLALGFGLFRLNRIYDSRLDVVRNEHRTGGTLVASYPLSRFDRVETSVVFRRATHHLFADGRMGEASLLSHYLTLVHDNAWLGGNGLTAGWRAVLSAGQTRDLSAGKGNFWTLRLEGRRYQELLPNVVWASRVRAEWATGEDAEPVRAGGFADLRGFPRRGVLATRLALMNHELRFPLVKSLILSTPGGGVRLPDIMAAPFVDVASFGQGRFESPVGSVGVGFYLFGGYFPAVRLDVAKVHDRDGWQPGTDTSFSVGFNF